MLPQRDTFNRKTHPLTEIQKMGSSVPISKSLKARRNIYLIFQQNEFQNKIDQKNKIRSLHIV